MEKYSKEYFDLLREAIAKGIEFLAYADYRQKLATPTQQGQNQAPKLVQPNK